MHNCPKPDNTDKIYQSIAEIASLLSVLEEQCHSGLTALAESDSELVEAAISEDRSADLEEETFLTDGF